MAGAVEPQQERVAVRVLDVLHRRQRVERAAKERDRFSSLAASAGSLEWPVQGELLRGFGRSVRIT